jgi:trimethylamine--corrinoid protein Co-methyltransferase
VLENIGFSEAIPSCIELFTDAGASMTDDGRLLISRAMVEDALAMAGRHFVLPGFDSKHDMEPWGTKVYFGTAGAAVHIVDLETRNYRESTLADLYDAARLVDAMDNIHFFQRSMVARDMEDPRASFSRSTWTIRWPCSTPSPAARTNGVPGRSSACPTVSSCRP